MMMNTQVRLNLEDEVREFVGDFNKFFEELNKWSKDDVEIKTWRELFEKKYPKMFSDSSRTEMDVDVDTTMETESRPIIDTEEKLRTLHCRDNCLKNAFFNRRKFTKKLWKKRRLQDSGRYFCENYTNLFSTTVNFNFALFPYVFFALTSR